MTASKPHSRDDFAALREAIPTLAEQKEGPAELWRVGHIALDALNRLEEQLEAAQTPAWDRLAAQEVKRLQEQLETAHEALRHIEGWANDEIDHGPPELGLILMEARRVLGSIPATESAVASGADKRGPSGEPGAGSVPARSPEPGSLLDLPEDVSMYVEPDPASVQQVAAPGISRHPAKDGAPGAPESGAAQFPASSPSDDSPWNWTDLEGRKWKAVRDE